MVKKRSHVADLRGVGRLAVEATRSVMGLVEAMHVAIASGPAVLGSPLAKPVKLATGLVYGTMKGVTEMVGAGVDLALAQLGPLLGGSAPGPERELVLAALNGVLGDYLEEEGNPLAIPMAFRRDVGERYSRVAVFVHGLCATDLMWTWQGHDHGRALEQDLGFTPLYVHYNSGLHISTNGAKLAALLEKELAAWPVPIEHLAIIGHSMGGLVARAALAAGDAAGHAWRKQVKSLVCLGAPHHGAPLERGGNWIDLLLRVSKYSAPLGKLARLRSAGITDLRFGNIVDAHWHGRDRFEFHDDDRVHVALPDGIATYAVAGTLSIAGGEGLLWDGMVPVDSALGYDPRLALAFTETHTALATGHLDLLSSAEVYKVLAGWFSAASR